MGNRRTVTVVMSTYNGALHLVRQLDSIFEQKGVEVRVLIRDDHSTDNTVELIERYKRENPKYQMEYIVGENEGYAKSFLDALHQAPETDYYAFADQDDVWMKDKLIKCIMPMEKDSYHGAKLSYCKMIRSNEDLMPLDEQVSVLRPEQLNKKIVLTQTFNYGAATVINRDAKELICRCNPSGYDVPHDLWAGLLCFWFGKVYYVDEGLYYWIRYFTSITGAGTKMSGRLYRLKESFRKRSYPNVAKDLIQNYFDLISPQEKKFLETLICYKQNFIKKLRLLFDCKFVRKTLGGTFMLKIGILMNWF